jgi:hypothetical protein
MCTAFGLALHLTGVAESEGVSPPALTRAVHQPRRARRTAARTQTQSAVTFRLADREVTLAKWHSTQ